MARHGESVNPGGGATPAARAGAWAGLVVAAILFGGTFVIVKDVLGRLPPHAFLAWRFLLGAGALALFGRPRGRRVWRDGALAGLALWAGYALQTVGLQWTTASHSGLITGLYVVVTPLLAAAAARRAVSGPTLAGGLLAVAGLALLSWPIELSLRSGDVLTLGCAVAFALHVVAVAHGARRHPVVAFTAVQLGVVAACSLVLSLALEGLPAPGPPDLVPILATGLGASAGAFLLQVHAQRVVGPGRAALVLSTEAAFAMLFGVLLAGDPLTGRGLLGGLLMIGAMQIALRVTADDDDLPRAEATSPAH